MAADEAATAYSLPSSSSFPAGLAAGPDGNLWFTEIDGNKIGRITPEGVITEFSIATPNSRPTGIAAGPDGNLWFTEAGANKIGRITTSGEITEYSVPTPGSRPTAIVAGPDDRLWFTESSYNSGNRVGRIDPINGAVEEFCIRGCGLPPYTSDRGLRPAGITSGPDQRVWFTMENPAQSSSDPYGDSGKALVGAVTMDGEFSEYALPTENARPSRIVTGPDDNLWITEPMAGKIARVTPSGEATEFVLPDPSSRPAGITSGPRDELWFTEFDGERIGSITTDGAITELSPIPDRYADLNQIAVGPDGQLWATESRYGRIWRFTVESAPMPEPAPAPAPEPAPEPTSTPTPAPPPAEPAPQERDSRPSPTRITVAGTRSRRAGSGAVRMYARGSLVPPQGQQAPRVCSGRVVLKFLAGRRLLRRVKAPLGDRCRFRATVRVNHTPSARLRVRAHFTGNKLLRPKSSRITPLRPR